MVIVYQSKTGFTKKYADMLSEATGMKAYPTSRLSSIDKQEEIVFLGWMKIGKIQGLKKVTGHNLIAVLGSGTGRTAEPDEETIISRNQLEDIPFFYARGGCLPIKSLKGLDRLLMGLFLRALRKRNEEDEETVEAIEIIENGFDGVKQENLTGLIEWLKTR